MWACIVDYLDRGDMCVVIELFLLAIFLVGNVFTRHVFEGALEDTSSDLSATCRRHVSVLVVVTLTTKPDTLTNRSRTGQAKKQQLTENTTKNKKHNDHDEPSHYPPQTALFLSLYTPAASDRWHDG